jgi:hypothetical protein
MAKTLQFRRDTTANLASVTGAVGEIFIDTTKKTVVVMDGSTAGGIPLEKQGAGTGATGVTGATGSAGTNGATGVTGASGTIGVDGATGSAGTNGATGVTGASGVTGVDGASGVTGASGVSVTGATGVNGASGVTGVNGATGVTGASGVQGASGVGTAGATGSAGAASVTDDTSTNASYYPTLSNVSTGAPAATYVSSTKLYFNPSTGTINATIFNSLSDIQFKENVSTVSNAVDIIKQLNGVSFTWKDNGNKSYGVIAQEIETILPELINHSEGKKSVNYNGIMAFLIQAIKEQQEQINELKAK